MKKKILNFTLFLIIMSLSGFIIYDKSEFLIDNSKALIYDDAKSVLNANIPEQEDITSFESEVYGTIYLSAGTEPKYGFRHILARHTSQYFINYDDKNGATFFDDELTGSDVILGIKEFYKHCVAVEAYNRKPERNITYVGYTTLNNDKVKCLLIVKKDSKEVVTFYPFKKVREEEILEEIELNTEQELKEQISKLQEQLREKQRENYYIYD